MDLIWWAVAMAGCLALAGCVAAALLWPQATEPAEMQPLANTARLTRLPEYTRAARRRIVRLVATLVLLVTAFAATVLITARPTGLPTWARTATAPAPEDIMVCVGAPADDPAVTATMQFFADRVPGFGTQRVGLTSANRRIIPLTRDYQYAAGQFGALAQPDGAPPLVSPVSYVDYAPSVEDVMAMCLTGFPDSGGQRRSMIYVGPGRLEQSGRPGLFTADRVGELAHTAGVQVNAISTDSGEGTPAALARRTGGRWFSGSADVAAHLGDIAAHPPQQADGPAALIESTETPGVPLALALLAVLGLGLIPVVMRR